MKSVWIWWCNQDVQSSKQLGIVMGCEWLLFYEIWTHFKSWVVFRLLRYNQRLNVPESSWYLLIYPWYLLICSWYIPDTSWCVPDTSWYVPDTSWFVPQFIAGALQEHCRSIAGTLQETKIILCLKNNNIVCQDNIIN